MSFHRVSFFFFRQRRRTRIFEPLRSTVRSMESSQKQVCPKVIFQTGKGRRQAQRQKRNFKTHITYPLYYLLFFYPKSRKKERKTVFYIFEKQQQQQHIWGLIGWATTIGRRRRTPKEIYWFHGTESKKSARLFDFFLYEEIEHYQKATAVSRKKDDEQGCVCPFDSMINLLYMLVSNTTICV